MQNAEWIREIRVIRGENRVVTVTGLFTADGTDERGFARRK